MEAPIAPMIEDPSKTSYAADLRQEATKHLRQFAVIAPTLGGLGIGAVTHMVVYNKALDELGSIEGKINDAQEVQDQAASNQVQLEHAAHVFRNNDVAVPKSALAKIAADKKIVNDASAEIKQLTGERPDIPSIDTFLVGGAIVCALMTWGVKRRIRTAGKK